MHAATKRLRTISSRYQKTSIDDTAQQVGHAEHCAAAVSTTHLNAYMQSDQAIQAAQHD